MLSAILENSGGFLLTGEVGSGKSRVANQLGAHLAAAGHSVATIDGPEIVAAEIGVRSLERQLTGTPLAANQAVVLIVDAAERLHRRTLHGLLAWLAVAQSRGDPLRLMLVGRPAIRELIDQADERLGREEISWRFELAPPDRCEEEQGLSARPILEWVMRYSRGRRVGLGFLWKRVRALARAEEGSMPATRTLRIAPLAAARTARHTQPRFTVRQSTSWAWAIARSARYTAAMLAAIALLWVSVSLFDLGANKTSSPGSTVQFTDNDNVPAASHPAPMQPSVMPDAPQITAEKEKAVPLDRIEPLTRPPPAVPTAPAVPDTLTSKDQPSNDAVGTGPQPTSPVVKPNDGLALRSAPAAPDTLASKGQPSNDAVSTAPQPASPVVKPNDGLALPLVPPAQPPPYPARSLEDKGRPNTHRSTLANRTGFPPKQPPKPQVALRAPPAPNGLPEQSDGHTDAAAEIPAAESEPSCQPYVSTVNYIGAAAHVSGMACHDSNGHWWLMNQQE